MINRLLLMMISAASTSEILFADALSPLCHRHHRPRSRRSRNALASLPASQEGPPAETRPDYSKIHGPLGPAVDGLLLRLFRAKLAARLDRTLRIPDSRRAPDDFAGIVELTSRMNAISNNRTEVQEMAREVLVSCFPSFVLDRYATWFAAPFPRFSSQMCARATVWFATWLGACVLRCARRCVSLMRSSGTSPRFLCLSIHSGRMRSKRYPWVEHWGWTARGPGEALPLPGRGGVRQPLRQFVPAPHAGLHASQHGIATDDDARLRDGRVSISVRQTADRGGGAAGAGDAVFGQVPDGGRHEELARRQSGYIRYREERALARRTGGIGEAKTRRAGPQRRPPGSNRSPGRGGVRRIEWARPSLGGVYLSFDGGLNALYNIRMS